MSIGNCAVLNAVCSICIGADDDDGKFVASEEYGGINSVQCTNKTLQNSITAQNATGRKKRDKEAISNKQQMENRGFKPISPVLGSM